MYKRQGHGGAVLMPHALADAGKADLHAVLFKDVRIGIAAVGDARALQGIACLLYTSRCV